MIRLRGFNSGAGAIEGLGLIPDHKTVLGLILSALDGLSFWAEIGQSRKETD